VSQPSGTKVVNVPPGELGTPWDVVYSFTQGASLYLSQSFAYLISTDPAGPVSFALTVSPAPDFMIGSGTIAATAYSLKWYAYDDAAPNYSGPVLCQINVPAAGDGGGGDGGINLDIDLSHYFTKAESSLPDTL